MKRLYVIGNGFDLAHDLPTRYLDYRDFLQRNAEYENFCMRMESTYGLGENTDYWWRDFETNLGDGSVFEWEFETMAETTIDEMVTDEGEIMYDVEETLRYHFEPYYKFMNDLNETVLEWVKSIDISEITPQFRRIKDGDACFLNFNYTEVLEEVYEIPWNKVCHIHGSLTDGSVIMGHGNLAAIEKYEEEAAEREAKWDKNGVEVSRGIYNFYRASFKDTSEIILNNTRVFEQYSEVDEIHIYGHSLDEVDMPYFMEIKKYVMDKAEWYIYVYCEEEELSEKAEEVIKNIECLKIAPENVHVLRTVEF